MKTSRRSLERNVTVRVFSSLKSLQLFNEDIVTNVYSLFGFEPFHNFHLATAEVFKDCPFTYLESDAIHSYRGKQVRG